MIIYLITKSKQELSQKKEKKENEMIDKPCLKTA